MIKVQNKVTKLKLSKESFFWSITFLFHPLHSFSFFKFNFDLKIYFIYFSTLKFKKGEGSLLKTAKDQSWCQRGSFEETSSIKVFLDFLLVGKID